MTRRKNIIQIIIVSIAVTALSLLYFFYPATNKSFHPKCIFHELTGLHCPGCGSQRSISALLTGNLLQAIDYNVLLVLCLPLLIYAAFVFTWNTFSKNNIQLAIFNSPIFAKTLLAVVILFWALRNLPLKPFSWLAP